MAVLENVSIFAMCSTPNSNHKYDKIEQRLQGAVDTYIYNRGKMKDEKIIVERGEIKRLAKIFNVTEEFVYMALRYARDSEWARKIRYVALKSKADGGCGGEVWRRVK